LWRSEYGIEEERNDGLPLELVKSELNDLNLKSEDVIKDRDWIGLFKRYTEGVEKENFDMFLREGKKGYEQFMEMCKENVGSDHLEPTYPIDLMWHSHMMHPREYERYCGERLMQELLVHEPWPEKFTVDQMFENLEESDEIWKKKYGASMHNIRDQFIRCGVVH